MNNLLNICKQTIVDCYSFKDIPIFFTSPSVEPPQTSKVTGPTTQEALANPQLILDTYSRVLENESLILDYHTRLIDARIQRLHDKKQVMYALFRVACATNMVRALGEVLVAPNLLSIASATAGFVFAHDMFQMSKNLQILEQEQLSVKVVAGIGKGIFSGGLSLLKSSLKGKSEEEVTLDTVRSTFKELASLQSKNTFLKPLWNEIQFQLIIAGYNPFISINKFGMSVS